LALNALFIETLSYLLFQLTNSSFQHYYYLHIVFKKDLYIYIVTYLYYKDMAHLRASAKVAPLPEVTLYEDDRPKIFDANLIDDGIYLGGIDAAYNWKEIQKRGITHILTVARDIEPRYYDKKITYMRVRVQDIWFENLISSFPLCHDFIDEALCSFDAYCLSKKMKQAADPSWLLVKLWNKVFGKTKSTPGERTGGCILIHWYVHFRMASTLTCLSAAGISRSATVVVSYLMRKYNKTFKEALTMVRDKRRWVCPNGGFQRQLALFQLLGCSLNAECEELREIEHARGKPSVELWHNGVKSSVDY
jgi:hypothetical protein